MRALLELIRNQDADSSLSFRGGIYRRGEQGALLRDLLALANASVAGRRFLILGADGNDCGARRFPGVTARSWKRFCEVLPGFLARAVEPELRFTTHLVEVGDAHVGAVCLENCEDKPYLLSRRVSATLPAGGGWIRSGTRQRRLLRKHLQGIFAARFRPNDAGEILVGFPGELPREELVLEVMPLDELPSRCAANKIQRMLDAKRVSRAVLGRSDSRIQRLVHAQVSETDLPYQEQGTRTMLTRLGQIPDDHAAADDHYRFEERAHRLNLLLSNLSDKLFKDVVVTLKFPRIDGFGIAERLYPAPNEKFLKHGLYPTVDVGPKTITVQARGVTVPRRGCAEAFYVPLRVLLREASAGQTVRVAYVVQGPSLASPVQGRLKILVAPAGAAGAITG